MVHKKTDSAQQSAEISSAEWGKLVERKRKEIVIVYGLIAAFGYSFVPLMLYLIPNNGPYGDLGSISNSTFFVTIQEILGALTMFIFYKPTNFIRYFKMLKHKETWLIVLYGLLGGPVAMVFFQLSVMLTITAAGRNDGTVPGLLLNLNVILAAIGSVIFFRSKQSKYTWTALIISTALIIGMAINFAIDKGLTWQSVGGMCLALITAFLYAIEAVGMYQLMRVSKINFSNQATVSIKTGTSAIIMVVLGTQLAAVASHQGFAYGYVIFQNFQYYNYALIFIAGGILMGFSRMLFYSALRNAGATYTTVTQLLMFFWTPILQYIFIAAKARQTIEEPTWYYWVYVIPIIICTFVISINEFIVYAEEVGWKKAFQQIRKVKVDSDATEI